MTKEQWKYRGPTCRKGHPYPEGKRRCQICAAARKRERRRRTIVPRYTTAQRKQDKIDALWQQLLDRPDCKYKSLMLEAREEMRLWDLEQRANRGKKIAVGRKAPRRDAA